VTLDEPVTMPTAGADAGPRRITVSVDALFS
jgi:hypothetical protein